MNHEIEKLTSVKKTASKGNTHASSETNAGNNMRMRKNQVGFNFVTKAGNNVRMRKNQVVLNSVTNAGNNVRKRINQIELTKELSNLNMSNRQTEENNCSNCNTIITGIGDGSQKAIYCNCSGEILLEKNRDIIDKQDKYGIGIYFDTDYKEFLKIKKDSNGKLDAIYIDFGDLLDNECIDISKSSISLEQIDNNIANNINILRLLYGLTMEELAEKVHTTRQYIGQIESLKKHPTIETLYNISIFFDVSISFLIYVDCIDWIKNY